MIRALYDTNTLASGMVSSGSVSLVIDAWINDEVELITSGPLIDELTRTLTKKYFTSRLTSEQTQKFVDLVKSRATIVQINTLIPKVATHPEDDIVLATAESGNANIIVSGDHGLQSLEKFKDIQIISPKTFLSILQTEKVK